MCHSTDLLEIVCCYGPAGAPSASSIMTSSSGLLLDRVIAVTFGSPWNTEVRVAELISGFGLGFGMIFNCCLVGNRERISASVLHNLRAKRIFAEQFIGNWQIISEVSHFSCMQTLMSNYAYCFLALQLIFTLQSLEARCRDDVILQGSAAGGV